jgi:DNA-binding beta-propeller fold protein YncE
MNRLPSNMLKALSLCVSLIATLCCTGEAQADDPKPLERIAIIELKGEAGALDHLFVDAGLARLFLANQSNNTLEVVDVKSNQPLKQVARQNRMNGVVYVPEFERIFIGNGEGVCNVLDARDYTLLKSLPLKGANNVRYDPRTKHVFVTATKRMAVIDAKTLELVQVIELPGSPRGLQVAAERPRLYVNTGPSCQVTVVDTDNNQVVGGYPFGDDKDMGPLALDEGNKRIFVGLRTRPRLAVLDLDTGKEVASVPIPQGSDDMGYDPKAKRIYTSCNSGFVSVIRQVNADRYEAVADVPTAKGAKTSFYNAATQRLYVPVPRQPGKEGPEIWVYQARP